MSVRATREIERLDRRLAKRGTSIELKHVTPGPSNKAIPYTVKLPAFVTQLGAQDIVQGGPLSQGDYHIVISPTNLVRGRWPGPQAKRAPGDPLIPVASSTEVKIDGKWRSLVGTPDGVKIDDVVIRIELNAKG